MKRLAQRMYFFVPYFLSDKQKGIHAGSAALNYAINHNDEKLKNFIHYDNVWVILDTGGTNDGHFGGERGDMQNLYESIRDRGIDHAIFMSTDINSGLSAICILVDERMWNLESYPDFSVYMQDKVETLEYIKAFKNGPCAYEQVSDTFPEHFDTWLELIGGENGLFLRELIRS
jgi:hypothetical protein